MREGRKVLRAVRRTARRSSARSAANPYESAERFCGECGAPLGASATAAGTAKNAATPQIRSSRGLRDGKYRGRAQDGDGAVRRHQGLDRADGGPRSGGGARDHRSGAEADDRRGASLRRLRRADHRRRHLRAVRRAGRARGPSAARTLRRTADAGRAATLFGQGCARLATCRSRRASASNTGEVVVRSIATGGGHTEYTPIGHTTNLASRMQALAPTGSIAISEQTRKLVEGYFALEAARPDQGQRASASRSTFTK